MKALLSGVIGNPLFLLIGAIVVFAAGAGTGWTANGWRLGAQLSDQKAERSDEIAAQNAAALQDLKEDMAQIKAAADGAGADIGALTANLAALQKDFKNANVKPLPVDCRPDAVRVRRLTGTADAIDKAIAGQRPGG